MLRKWNEWFIVKSMLYFKFDLSNTYFWFKCTIKTEFIGKRVRMNYRKKIVHTTPLENAAFHRYVGTDRIKSAVSQICTLKTVKKNLLPIV